MAVGIDSCAGVLMPELQKRRFWGSFCGGLVGVVGVFLRGAGMVTIHELFLFDIIIDVLSNIFIKSAKS